MNAREIAASISREETAAAISALEEEEEISDEERQAQELYAKRLRVLKKDGTQLANIDVADYTRELCAAALTQNGMVLEIIPEDMRDIYLSQKAIRSKGMALQFVPDRLRSRNVCLQALRRDGMALQFVPMETRDREVCLVSLARDAMCLCFVPREHVDEDLCRAAMRVNGRALEYVPEELRTKDMCFEACRTSGLALPYVPADLVDDILRVRGLLSAASTVVLTTDVDFQVPPDWEDMSKNCPRENWGRYERWIFTPPQGPFPLPEEFAMPADEVRAFLKKLATDYTTAAGRPDFVADPGTFEPGKGTWIDLVDDRGVKRAVYAPGLAMMLRGEADERGVPVHAGGRAAAEVLLDWASGWTYERPAKTVDGDGKDKPAA